MTLKRWCSTVLMLMVCMGLMAKVDVKIEQFTGGTITASVGDEKGGEVIVTLTVTPNDGYTITKDDIEVYATISPNGTRTDEPQISSKLTLKGDDPKDLSEKRDYTVTVASNFGVWVKTANFLSGSKGPNRTVDYSGTYYIASNYIKNKVNQYDPVTLTNNYYLCPTEGWAFYESGGTVTGTDNGQPFITTHKKASGDEAKYKWIVKKHTIEDVDYYSFKYGVDYTNGESTITRYLSYSRQLTGAGVDRMRVHLEKTDSPGDNELFRIVVQGSYLVISPKNTDADDANKTKYLTVNGDNVNNYVGNSGKTGGPTGYENTKGIVGTYWDITDVRAPFYLEPLPLDPSNPPTITLNNGTITITGDEGATIYYTTNGDTPAPSTVITGLSHF